MNKFIIILNCLLFLAFQNQTQAQALDTLILNTISEEIKSDTIITHEPAFRIDTLDSFLIPTIDSLICFAESYIGTPYQYGSKGPNSFDCSGFSGFVFRHFGITLANSSTYQYKEAPLEIEQIDSARQGDLIFFMGRNGRKSVGHVGIVVDVDTAEHSCTFIHAATHGGVIETKYPSSAYYNQRFMGFGRYELPAFILSYKTEKIYLEDDTIDKTSTGE